MFKAYRYRIYPNQDQVGQLNQHFGCVRWVHNWAIERKRDHYAQQKQNLSIRQIQDELIALKKTKEKSWLKEVNSQALLAALMNVKAAFSNFFEKRAGRPKFKKKYDSEQSYQCPQHVKIDFINKAIHLPKIGWIKAKLHRKFDGMVKTTTITRTPSGHFYASVLVKTHESLPIPTTVQLKETIGIDLGINAFLVTSDGLKKEGPKFLRKGLKQLRKLQRRLSKKQLKSHNRAKAKRKLARCHEKIKNQRLSFSHQISSELVFKNHATSFAIEDLNIKGMLKNRKLSKAVSDCGWSEFVRQLRYKSAWMGKNVLKIGRWDPSSKRCSGCGLNKETLSLSERVYQCVHCGLSIDRDLNAAINIKQFALAQNRDGIAQIQACGSCNGGDVSEEALLSLKISSHHGMKQEAPLIKCA